MIVNTINKAGSGGGSNNYVYSFQEQNWEQNSGLYTLSINSSQHPLGTGCYVSAVEKLDRNSYYSTMFSYDRLPNGTIIINSELPFNGRAILEED